MVGKSKLSWSNTVDNKREQPNRLLCRHCLKTRGCPRRPTMEYAAADYEILDRKVGLCVLSKNFQLLKGVLRRILSDVFVPAATDEACHMH